MDSLEAKLCNNQMMCSDMLSDILHEITPYVTAICRKYIENKSDAEDAAQETLVKYVNHYQNIHSNHSAWLARTARNTAISINRHQQSQRLRRQNSATIEEHTIPWDALYYRLDQALLSINEECRDYIIQHHINNLPLIEIARQRQISKSTASRRLASAHQALRNYFKDINLETYDDICNDFLFVSAITNYTPQHTVTPNTFENDPQYSDDLNAPPIRIGVFLSHKSFFTTNRFGNHSLMRFQIVNLRNFEHPNVRIVGLIEPGSIDYGPIESTLREYSFNAGYMNATDVDALKTLDVITLGHNCATTPSVINAVDEAVKSGVGLLNEGNAGLHYPGMHDPQLCDFLLAQKYCGYYHTHTHKCHHLIDCVVKESHDIIPGLSAGTNLDVPGCGPIFIPKPNATVLIEDAKPVLPSNKKNAAPHPTPVRKPVLVVGNHGKGRIIVNTAFFFSSIGSHKQYRGDFIFNMLNYLAEPRIEQRMQMKY
ncbi:sigma-70 family RNA polymerase sigma factor [Planctomycetota bacterium]|nr:sigma-70 family RNA polymerase sigma factor [Planctomycetota bacterium]